jgi:hypothetical protein
MWLAFRVSGADPQPVGAIGVRIRKECRAMDPTVMTVLALVLAATVIMGALVRIITRPRTTAHQGAGESPFAISTEGMKVCPRCGMGNLWTERRCSSCGNGLKG